MNNNQLQQQQQQTRSDVVKFDVAGKEIKLSPTIVQQFVTKGNGKISMEEAVNFINLCRYAELNPFLNEVYLVKFGNSPAQMITGKEAFMKRANRHPDYDGFKAGVVVMRGNEVYQKEGQLIYPNEELLGGWARVYRKNIDQDFYVEVGLREFSKNQSTWKSMPANMIRKVAIVNALREAFPEDLGAMYTEEEAQDVAPKNVTPIPSEPEPATQNLIDKFNQQDEPEEPEQPEPPAEVDDAIIEAEFEQVSLVDDSDLAEFMESQGVETHA